MVVEVDSQPLYGTSFRSNDSALVVRTKASLISTLFYSLIDAVVIGREHTERKA